MLNIKKKKKKKKMRTQEKIKDLTETLIPKEDIISQSLNISQDDHLKSQEEAMKKLTLVCVICLVFMTIEIIGGYLANSIAIMSDAAHLLSDFLGFVISILSIYISRRVATTEMSYGFHRAEIIGALVSIALIWGLTIWLLYEATLRIIETPPVDGFIMVLVSIIGFAFNLIMGLVLAYQGIGHVHLHSHDHNHNHNHNHNMKKKKKMNIKMINKIVIIKIIIIIIIKIIIIIITIIIIIIVIVIVIIIIIIIPKM